MASPEYLFRPQEFYAPDMHRGEPSCGSTEYSSLDPVPVTDLPHIEQNAPSDLEYRALVGGALHLIPLSDADSTSQIALETSISGQSSHGSDAHFSTESGTASVQESWAELREERRRIWEETGYIAPIAGGSPRRKVELPLGLIRQRYYEGELIKDIARDLNVSPATIRERLTEIHQQLPTREEAKVFVEAYYSRSWNRRRDERIMGRILGEVSRLNELYPGLSNEVYTEIKRKIRMEERRQG